MITHIPFCSFRISNNGQGSFGSGHSHWYRQPVSQFETEDSAKYLPFKRRFSPRKPTSPSALLRTRLTMTASFSRPWKPSTLPNSMPGNRSFRGASKAS